MRNTEFAIDPSNQFIDNSPEVLVFLDILPAGNRNLNENNFSNPFRVVCQEHFERMQFLGNAFNVVQSINSHHQLYSLKFLFQGCNALLNLLPFETFGKFLWVDANRKCSNGNNFTLEFNTIWRC